MMFLNNATYVCESEDVIYNSETDALLTRKEAARYIGFSHGTLAVWDCTGRYNLKPVKIGRSVRYRKSVLDLFLQAFMNPQ